jgi:hypothetical protein
MATSGTQSERWLEIDVCLMNKQDQQNKTAGILDVKKVNMINMPIKVDTG